MTIWTAPLLVEASALVAVFTVGVLVYGLRTYLIWHHTRAPRRTAPSRARHRRSPTGMSESPLIPPHQALTVPSSVNPRNRKEETMLLQEFEEWLTQSLRMNPHPDVSDVRTFAEAGFSRTPIGTTVTFASGGLAHLQPLIVAPPGFIAGPKIQGGDPGQKL
jgi:hypothetical protein